MAIEFLPNDSQARVAFIDKIAAPVANNVRVRHIPLKQSKEII
jgi:hypothetical protein